MDVIERIDRYRELIKEVDQEEKHVREQAETDAENEPSLQFRHLDPMALPEYQLHDLDRYHDWLADRVDELMESLPLAVELAELTVHLAADCAGHGVNSEPFHHRPMSPVLVGAALDQLRAAVTAPVIVPEVATVANDEAPLQRRETANNVLLRHISKDPTKRIWTDRQWEDLTGIGKDTIRSCRVWKDQAPYRKLKKLDKLQKKAERDLKRPKKDR